MREVIIGILSTEEIEAEAKFSETENMYRFETLSKYREIGELIRCKDCKCFDGEYCHSEYLNLHLEPCGLDGGADFCPPEDFYCAYGERKEE